MVLTLLRGMKMIQIPMNYSKRVGTSSVTGDFWLAVRLGLRMVRLVISYRVRSWVSPGAFRA